MIPRRWKWTRPNIYIILELDVSHDPSLNLDTTTDGETVTRGVQLAQLHPRPRCSDYPGFDAVDGWRNREACRDDVAYRRQWGGSAEGPFISRLG